MWRLIVVSLVWAFSFGLTKGNLAGLDSAFVSAARLVLAWLVFVPFLARRPPGWGQVLPLLCGGAIQFGAMYLALIASYAYLPAHLVALLTCVTPIWVLLLLPEPSLRLRRLAWIAALLSVAAGAVLTYRADPGQVTAWGVVLVQLANLCFAYGQVFYRKLPCAENLPAAQRFAWMYTGAILLVVPVALFKTNGTWPTVNVEQGLTLLYLGTLASGLCFFLWNEGARRVTPGVLAVMNNAKVPLAVVCSLVFFQESADVWRLLAACLLLLVALWLVRR